MPSFCRFSRCTTSGVVLRKSKKGVDEEKEEK